MASGAKQPGRRSPLGGRAVRRRRLFARGDRRHPGYGTRDGALGRVSRAAKAAGAAGRLKGGLVRQEPAWSPDHRDPALGAALWAALSPRDDGAAFVARALARAAAAGVGTWRAVLGRWSRIAVTAAAIVALAFVGSYLAGAAGRTTAGASFDSVWVTSATGSDTAAELLATHRAPDPSALFTSMVAN